MDTKEMLIGVIILGAFLVAIGLMIAISWKVALEAVRKDVEKDNDVRVNEAAEKKYQAWVKNTEYHVTQRLVITDEMAKH